MTNKAIFTPRMCVTLMERLPGERNKSVCTKIPYRGYEISIAMDSSHGDGDLSRSDIVIYDHAQKDVTFELLTEYSGVVPATAESLKEAFAAIDATVGEPA